MNDLAFDGHVALVAAIVISHNLNGTKMLHVKGHNIANDEIAHTVKFPSLSISRRE